MDHWCRDPMMAAGIAAGVTIAYVYAKNSMNGEQAKVPNSAYFKPALLVAILVYFIVNYGHGTKESISHEPF
jgi:hypothetical protein